MPKSKSRGAELAQSDRDERLTSLLASEQTLLGQLKAIELTQAKHGDCVFDRDVALASAAVTRALTGVRGELRQHLKAQIRAIAAIPLEQLAAYVKTLPESTKTEFCDRVMRDDSDDPLL